MEVSWLDYVKAALLVMAGAAWIAVVLYASNLAIETAWTWLMSKLGAWVAIRWPMFAQSVFGAIGSSSTATAGSRK